MTKPEQPDADPLVEAKRAFDAAQTARARTKARLKKAKEADSEAWSTFTERRTDLAKVIADQARQGRRNVDIRRVTGYTAERVRQICRDHGVEAPE